MTRRQLLHEEHSADREKHTNAVVDSSANHVIVAAGPGSGKTFLFKKICEQKHGSILVVSFINELINDLKTDLSQLAEVRTLHSFATKQLNADFFPKLTDVIENDRNLYVTQAVDFKEIFSNLQNEYDDELNFYSERRKYYNHFGPHCSIYALIKLFEQNPDKIPTYSQILVDEYQDFNKLEIKLIDKLAEKSPLLLVGDDDQALYSFKYADPAEIRLRFNSNDYQSFELPYCSRCPEVIVRAANNLISEAMKRGDLKERIEKTFKYFCCSDKDQISDQHPKIIIRQPVYENAVAYRIEQDLREIAALDDEYSVLIICPLRKQIPALAMALQKKGFGNVKTPTDSAGLSKKEGYKLLLENDQCNLGWRILAQFKLDNAGLSDLVRKSVEDGISVKDILGAEHQKKITRSLRILKKLRNGKSLSDKEASDILDELDYDALHIAAEKVKEEVVLPSVSGVGFKNAAVKIVTMLGAKGLSGDYVFIVNCDDRYILEKNSVTDASICRFLVAITRARKKLTIYSSKEEIPTYVKWLKPELTQSR